MPRTTSKDNRPRVDVSVGGKVMLKDLKKHLNYKTEAEVIAYLLALYDLKYPEIKVSQDRELRERVKVLMNQEVWQE